MSNSIYSNGPTDVMLIFIQPNKEKEYAMAKIGDSILDVAHKHDIEMEGACGGEAACSTCHCILSAELYKRFV